MSNTNLRARPKPFTFYPPKNNRFLIGILKIWIRRSIRKTVQVTDVEISDDDIQRLRQLRGKRCLLTPSHSGGFEPHIVMFLSKLLQDDFNFVAAMELFERSRISRWILPRLGVYSIIRGAVDRPSFSMTRQLLASGKRWLVIFPEGEAIWQNSMVIPFQQGVIQLAFKGYEDATKTDKEASLYCIPMAIKYVYHDEMYDELDEALARLESKLSITDDIPDQSRYLRLRRIAEAVLVANEKVENYVPEPDSTLNERITGLKLFVLTRMEQRLGVKSSARHTPLDRIRALFNKVDRIVHEEPKGSEYEQQLITQRQEAARVHYDNLWRLLQFVAIYDGYVKESMTFERFMDVLGLLHMEVFRDRRIWGPRKALVKVGEPIDLRDRAPDYLKNKRDTVRAVTESLETSVVEMLDDLERGCKIVEDTTQA